MVHKQHVPAICILREASAAFSQSTASRTSISYILNPERFLSLKILTHLWFVWPPVDEQSGAPASAAAAAEHAMAKPAVKDSECVARGVDQQAALWQIRGCPLRDIVIQLVDHHCRACTVRMLFINEWNTV
jgi:hypothetical protein